MYYNFGDRNCFGLGTEVASQLFQLTLNTILKPKLKHFKIKQTPPEYIVFLKGAKRWHLIGLII